MNQKVEEITDLVHARSNHFESYESRFEKIDKITGSLDTLLVSDWEIEELNDNISWLMYQKEKGRLNRAIRDTSREIDWKSVDSVIEKLQNKRTMAFERLYDNPAVLYSEKSLVVNDIKEITEGNRQYEWKPRLESITEHLTEMKTSRLSLNDLDTLEYVKLLLIKNNYLSKKENNNAYIAGLKCNIVNEIQEKIGDQTRAYKKEDNIRYVFSKDKNATWKEKLKKPMSYIGKAVAIIGLIAAPFFLTTCAVNKYAYKHNPAKQEISIEERATEYDDSLAAGDSTIVAIDTSAVEKSLTQILEDKGPLISQPDITNKISEIMQDYVVIPSSLIKLETEMPYALIVEKSSQKMFLYERLLSQQTWRLAGGCPISTGINPGSKIRRGDHKTPTGSFEVVEVNNSKNWVSPFDGSRNAYGAYFLRLNCGWWDRNSNYYPNAVSPIGLHGTNNPKKLGMPDSRGCIRAENQVINRLVETGYVTKRTPVIITEKIAYMPVIVST